MIMNERANIVRSQTANNKIYTRMHRPGFKTGYFNRHTRTGYEMRQVYRKTLKSVWKAYEVWKRRKRP